MKVALKNIMQMHQESVTGVMECAKPAQASIIVKLAIQVLHMTAFAIVLALQAPMLLNKPANASLAMIHASSAQVLQTIVNAVNSICSHTRENALKNALLEPINLEMFVFLVSSPAQIALINSPAKSVSEGIYCIWMLPALKMCRNAQTISTKKIQSNACLSLGALTPTTRMKSSKLVLPLAADKNT